MNVLVAYASVHGSTGEIAQFIGDVLQARQLTVTIEAVEQIQTITTYDAFVLGSAIHSGFWLPAMSKFINRFHVDFEQKPIHFFVSCIRVLEEGGYEHVVEHYIRHDVLTDLNVGNVAAFAGKLKLAEVDWNERWTLAAHYDGGHAPKEFNGDFRNWDTINEWALKVAQELTAHSKRASAG